MAAELLQYMPSFFLADVKKYFKQKFSSSFDLPYIGLENLMPPGFTNSSEEEFVNLKRILLQKTREISISLPAPINHS